MLFYVIVPNRLVVGASGAIMGVVGAYAVFFPRNDVVVFWWVVVRIGTVSLPSFLLIGIWFVLDFAYLVFGVENGTAYISHVAGSLVGFAIALQLAWSRRIRPTAYEQTIFEALGVRGN